MPEYMKTDVKQSQGSQKLQGSIYLFPNQLSSEKSSWICLPQQSASAVVACQSSSKQLCLFALFSNSNNYLTSYELRITDRFVSQLKIMVFNTFIINLIIFTALFFS